MANSITDNRTLLTANDTTDASLVDAAGTAVGASDTSNFIEGDGSWGAKVSATVTAMMHNAGSAQDWSSNHFYIWAACSFPIDTFANGGLRVRFCGATVTDYFEKNVRGVDTGYSGGFECLVVDIEKARADAVAGTDGAVGGTAPATTAIQYVGVVFDVPGMVSGNFNNCNVDAMWRLPSNTPGILVQGQDQTGSAHDWTIDDIFQAADPGDTSKAWGTVFKKDGVYTINTPITFGANDTVTHGFSDTNVVVAWEDNLVADNFYRWTISGGASGTMNFELGIKTGTGDAATGAQGLTMVASEDGGASSYGNRYVIAGQNANADAINLYGCNFIHGGDFRFDNANASVISCLFNDCTSALITGTGDFLRNTIVNANTADDVAFLSTDDLGDLKHNSFTFSDGHAIDMLSGGPTSQSSTGNRFFGYGAIASTDSALENNNGGAVTVSITSPGTVAEHTYINVGGGTSTTLSQDVEVTLTGLQDNTEVRVMSAGTDTELTGIEDATTGVSGNRSFAFTLSASTLVDIFIVSVLYENIEIYAYSIPSADTSLPQAQRLDRVYLNN